MRLLSKSVTVTHTSSTAVDAMGRPVPTTVTFDVPCAFKHRLANDTLDGATVATDETTFYFSPATVVALGDLITLDSDTYEVVSDPFPETNFRTGSVHHLRVRGRKRVR
jgi:hypothetical protein